MLRSNSSSMTNISMQSSHNGYLSGLSPYVPQLSSQAGTHQLHAVHTIMPPPQQAQNLDTSFHQFAYHPNSYSTMHHSIHNAHTRQENAPLISSFAPHHSIQTPSHQLVSSQTPWPLAHPANQLGHLHTIQPHHSMQTSPNSSNAHHQSILPQPQGAIPAVTIIQNNSGNLVQQQTSEPNTPSSTPNSNLLQQPQQQSNSSNQQSNANLVQPQIQHPQPSITPTNHPIHHQAWYHPQTNLIANPNTNALQPGQQSMNPAFSQAIAFSYPPGYGTLMSTAHWQPHQNPYLYGNCIF